MKNYARFYGKKINEVKVVINYIKKKKRICLFYIRMSGARLMVHLARLVRPLPLRRETEIYFLENFYPN
jgi:hypothetical protein